MNTDLETQTPAPRKETPTPPEFIIKEGLVKDFGMKSIVGTMGIICTIIGVIALFTLPTGAFLLGIGILYIIMGASTPLKFRERSFIFKPAPAATRKEISYNEITKIEYQPKRITVYYRETQVKIEKGTFNTDDWKEICEIFKTIK